MRLSFKYRLYPNRQQEQLLNQQLWACCQLYNAALQERIYAYRSFRRRSISLYDQTYQLKDLRATGEIQIDTFTVAWDVLNRLDKAYKGFFDRVKRYKSGDKYLCDRVETVQANALQQKKPIPSVLSILGQPKFRASRYYDSLTFASGFNQQWITNKDVKLPKIGKVKMNLHRPVEGKVKTCSIKREAGRWYVIFSCEVEAKPLPANDKRKGLDVGIFNYVSGPGVSFDNYQFYKNAERKLRIAQRKVARRKKGSNGRKKAVLELQRAHELIRNQRADYQHKVSRELVNSYGKIAMEELGIKNMIAETKRAEKDKTNPRHGVAKYGELNKKIHDAGWAGLIQKVEYKAALNGRQFAKVDPAYTNKCTCGGHLKRNLQAKYYWCEQCQRKVDLDLADVLAGKEILARANFDKLPALTDGQQGKKRMGKKAKNLET